MSVDPGRVDAAVDAPGSRPDPGPVDVVTAVEAVPSRGGAAALVLAVVDDPAADARDLARAVSADPALSCRVLALANSSYYGLSRRVSTLELAVSVVGFNTVRALALTLAAGLAGPDAAPEGFWEAAALCATAAGVLAPMFGAPPGDAFCLGLLHTVGAGLLHRSAPLPGLCLPVTTAKQEHDLVRGELETYGTTHSEVGAQALESWSFPAAMCELIASHHHPVLPDTEPLARVLHMARLCTSLVLDDLHDRADRSREPETGADADAGRVTSLTGELARISQGRLAHLGSGPSELVSLLGEIRTRATPLQTALLTTT